jgi:hypothetical protein
VTDDLLVTARFPLGLYQGGGADGIGQEFPAPSRLVAALLSVCGTEGVGVVRKLFDAGPPVIEHPDVTPGVASSWWRPQSGRWRDAFDVNKQTASGRIEGRPLPHAAYGDAPVWYRWDGLGELADALRPVAARVPYLGRATGPVALQVERATEQSGPVDAGRVRLTPTPNGTEHVTVQTRGLLDDLEAAHASRLELGIAGFDLPVEILRAEAAYTRTVGRAEPDLGTGVCVDWRAVDGYLAGQFTTWKPASAVPATSVDLCCHWLRQVTRAQAVLPVPDREGLLRTVLVDGVDAGAARVEAATFAGVVTFAPDVMEGVTASQRWLGARLLGTSPLWVSHVGIDPDDAVVGRALIESLAQAAGAAVVGCSTSSAPRDARLPHLGGTGMQYLTVQFGQPVSGPVRARAGAGGTVHFLPVDPQNGALL